jgi:hypothetical protein
MSTYIGPITQDILNACITEVKKPENKERISKHIIDPITYQIFKKVKLYYMIIVGIQLLTLVLLGYAIFRKN